VKSEPRYQTAAGLRMALEERLNRQAREKGLDVLRLRRHVAFDRFLARIFSGPASRFVLKGGYAFELWLDRARATKDIDLSFKVGKGGRQGNKKIVEANALLESLQDLVSTNSRDFFEFIIGKAVMDLENAPYGGWRFPVEVRLAGYVFVRFAIDVAAGDLWLEPHELAQTTDWLGFAGISAPGVPVISREQQFAEKLHAYTRPRQTPNSRVKDLVDLLLLVHMHGIDPGKIRTAAEKTFARRGTHPFPPAFPLPPASWGPPFRKLAQECGIEIALDQAVGEIRAFCIKHGLVI
jgi:hypothetical protein